MEEHEPGTSASTIRGLRHLDMSFVLNSTVTQDEHGEEYVPSPYHPPSPLSTSQSEPDSPSGDSVSSLPSVSSSFLFSSGPASPPHIHQHSEQDSELGDSTSGLIIPSLTLPSPSTRPTPYGQTLGELRLLVLGHNGADVNAVASDLVDENEDVVEVGPWEDNPPNGGLASLRVSTHWVEHRDPHGLERIEPARNVEIIKLPSYDAYSQVRLVSSILMVVLIIPIGGKHRRASASSHPLAVPSSLEYPEPRAPAQRSCCQPSFILVFSPVYCSHSAPVSM